MSNVIRVENVSKQYRLGEVGTGTLSHDVNRWWHKLRGKEDPYLKVGESNDRTKKGESDYSWALRDVSFNVKQGEVLGIIGRNGAGKSTLLKILSRVTTPTSGAIKVRGRIASLLEVGTGFHPELTGRENIYLNGAILGMRKHEITQKFDEIVEFSGCERYIDTPVKRYSSGMYVRLAFAVAAHLEPEILIVDEVLAVGDSEFQRKCLGKMKDVAGQGRTVLFVSHNMQAVATLCSAAAWLERGIVHQIGAARSIVTSYISRHTTDWPDQNTPLSLKPRSGSGSARFTGLTISPSGESPNDLELITSGSSVSINIEISAESQIKSSNVAVTIYDQNEYRLIDINTAIKGEFLSLNAGERANIQFEIQEFLVKPGSYLVELWLGRGGIETIDCVTNAAVIEVGESIETASHSETFPGTYQCRFTHNIQKVNHEILISKI